MVDFRSVYRCVAACLILLASSAGSQAQDLRIATEGFYAPFNSFADDGELVGFDIDIANALCETIGATCEMTSNDWDDLIPGLLADEYDIIIASMSITPERQELVAFTLPYYSNMLTFIGPEDRGLEVSEAGLSGKTVGAQRSTVSSEYLERTYASLVEIKLFDNQDELLEALVNASVDLVLGDNLPSYAWLESEDGKGFGFIGEFIDIDDRIGIAARQSDMDLIDQLNEALITIIGNGTYQEINAKYFPFSIYF